jgi:hypothetical protein
MVALAWVMALTLGPVLLTIMFVGSPRRLEQADRVRAERQAAVERPSAAAVGVTLQSCSKHKLEELKC